jgi:hypothetical protein
MRKRLKKEMYKERRKLMMRLKQVQCRGKKIQTKRKVLLLHVQLIRIFNLSLECNKGPKHLFLRKEKTVTLF